MKNVGLQTETKAIHALERHSWTGEVNGWKQLSNTIVFRAAVLVLFAAVRDRTAALCQRWLEARAETLPRFNACPRALFYYCFSGLQNIGKRRSSWQKYNFYLSHLTTFLFGPKRKTWWAHSHTKEGKLFFFFRADFNTRTEKRKSKYFTSIINNLGCRNISLLHTRCCTH